MLKYLPDALTLNHPVVVFGLILVLDVILSTSSILVFSVSVTVGKEPVVLLKRGLTFSTVPTLNPSPNSGVIMVIAAIHGYNVMTGSSVGKKAICAVKTIMAESTSQYQGRLLMAAVYHQQAGECQ